MIGDTINGFGINHNLSENNQIGNVFSDFGISVNDRVTRLLIERNIMIPEIDDQYLLVGLFMVSMSQGI